METVRVKIEIFSEGNEGILVSSRMQFFSTMGTDLISIFVLCVNEIGIKSKIGKGEGHLLRQSKNLSQHS